MQFSLSALLILVAYSAVATCLFLWFDEPGLLLSLLIAGMLLMAAGYVKHRRGIAISGLALFLIAAATAPLLLSVAIGDGSREVEVRLIIVDSETHQPISLARVEIEGGAFGGDSTSSTLTDANGIAWFVSEFPWSSRGAYCASARSFMLVATCFASKQMDIGQLRPCFATTRAGHGLRRSRARQTSLCHSSD